MNRTASGGTTRRPAVAGQFYPGQPEALRSDVQRYLDQVGTERSPAAKALIAPHAGYVYSGPIAASAFACWRHSVGTVRRVVLIGPAHYVGFPGVAVSSASAFATPLGEISIDRDAVSRLLELPGVRCLDEAHRPEHALEVELPFLQLTVGEFSLVPLLVGDAEPDLVARVLEVVWNADSTRIVVSSDLSHYLDYRAARTLDAATAEAIRRLDGSGLGSNSACGKLAIQGLLQVAQRKGLSASVLDLRNSGDTAGSRDRVVGYGAFAFQEGS
jgi:hypothetical protein